MYGICHTLLSEGLGKLQWAIVGLSPLTAIVLPVCRAFGGLPHPLALWPTAQQKATGGVLGPCHNGSLNGIHNKGTDVSRAQKHEENDVKTRAFFIRKAITAITAKRLDYGQVWGLRRRYSPPHFSKNGTGMGRYIAQSLLQG